MRRLPPLRNTNQRVDSVTIDGHTLRVGDGVCFKCDIEQCGTIIEIVRGQFGTTLTVENINGFDGGYIGGETITDVQASDCWVE